MTLEAIAEQSLEEWLNFDYHETAASYEFDDHDDANSPEVVVNIECVPGNWTLTIYPVDNAGYANLDKPLYERQQQSLPMTTW